MPVKPDAVFDGIFLEHGGLLGVERFSAATSAPVGWGLYVERFLASSDVVVITVPARWCV